MSYNDAIDRILAIEQEAVASLRESLDREVCARLIDLLIATRRNGKKVITSGCGTSGVAAQHIAHLLNVARIPAFYCSPAGSIHGDLGAVCAGDVVVLISKSGKSPEMTAFLPVCRAVGATVVAVSQNDASLLAREADVYFRVYTAREADVWNMCGSASAGAVCAAWDALIFTAMESMGMTKEELLLIHAGGGVGAALRGE